MFVDHMETLKFHIFMICVFSLLFLNMAVFILLLCLDGSGNLHRSKLGDRNDRLLLWWVEEVGRRGGWEFSLHGQDLENV